MKPSVARPTTPCLRHWYSVKRCVLGGVASWVGHAFTLPPLQAMKPRWGARCIQPSEVNLGEGVDNDIGARGSKLEQCQPIRRQHVRGSRCPAEPSRLDSSNKKHNDADASNLGLSLRPETSGCSHAAALVGLQRYLPDLAPRRVPMSLLRFRMRRDGMVGCRNRWVVKRIAKAKEGGGALS